MQQSPDLAITINLCVSLCFMCLLQHNGCCHPDGRPRRHCVSTSPLNPGTSLNHRDAISARSPLSILKSRSMCWSPGLAFPLPSPHSRPSLPNTFSDGPIRSWQTEKTGPHALSPCSRCSLPVPCPSPSTCTKLNLTWTSDRMADVVQ